MTYTEAVNAAKADFEQAKGTVIRPEIITVYVGNDSVDIEANGTVSCRVLDTSDDDLRHDTGGFLDPYWNVEIVSDDSGVLPSDYRNPWVFGPAHEYA